MTVLTRDAIWKEIIQPEDTNDCLVITPLLDPKQVGASSVDVRLGHQFIVLRRAAVTHVDATDARDIRRQIERSQQKIRVSIRQPFIIHPGQLALGATLEYLSMPTHLAATVEGRSSWGRLGLIIATACNIEPGFKGCITLELVNNGEAPLVLYPGVRIAQFVFHRAKPNAQRDEEKYDYPVGPQFSRIDKDKEMPFWGKPPLRIQIQKPSPQEETEMKSWPMWQIEPSEFPWHYEQQETCLVLEGEVTVEAPNQTVSFGAGDYVIFPQGLDCIWKVKKMIRKHCKFG